MTSCRFRLVLYIDKDNAKEVLTDGTTTITGKQLLEQVARAQGKIDKGKAYEVETYLDGLMDFLRSYDDAQPREAFDEKFISATSWASADYVIVQDGLSYCLSYCANPRSLVFEAYEEN